METLVFVSGAKSEEDGLKTGRTVGPHVVTKVLVGLAVFRAERWLGRLFDAALLDNRQGKIVSDADADEFGRDVVWNKAVERREKKRDIPRMPMSGSDIVAEKRREAERSWWCGEASMRIVTDK